MGTLLLGCTYRASLELTNTGHDVARYRVAPFDTPDVRLIYKKGGVQSDIFLHRHPCPCDLPMCLVISLLVLVTINVLRVYVCHLVLSLCLTHTRGFV